MRAGPQGDVSFCCTGDRELGEGGPEARDRPSNPCEDVREWWVGRWWWWWWWSWKVERSMSSIDEPQCSASHRICHLATSSLQSMQSMQSTQNTSTWRKHTPLRRLEALRPRWLSMADTKKKTDGARVELVSCRYYPGFCHHS